MNLFFPMRNAWQGYIFAVAVTVVVTLLKIPVAEVAGYETPLVFFPLAVMIVAWFGGVGPGLFAIGLNATAAGFFFIDPLWSFQFDAYHAQRIFFFLFEAAILCGLVVAVRRSKAHLRRSRQKTSDILGSIGDLFFAVDPDWRITYVNEGIAKLAGSSPEELIGENLWRTIPEWTGTPVEENLRKAMQEQTAVHFESQGVLTDDWYEVSVYPSEDGLSVYGRSITERRSAELELRENKKRLKLALEVAGMVSWEWEPQTDRLITTDVLRDLYGLPEIATAAEVRQLIHPEDLDRCDQTFQDVAENGGRYYIDYRIMRPGSGEVIWLEEWGFAEENDEEEVHRVSGVTMDVTERKRVEEVLRRQANMLDLSHDAIFVWRLDNAEIQFWNRGARELYGFTTEEAQGQVACRLLQVEREESFDKIKESLNLTGRWEGECCDITKSGRKIIVSTRMQVVEGEDGTPVVLTSGRDITGRKQHEEALEQEKIVAEELAQAKTALLADMSHEVRTPLTGLLLMAENLSKRIDGKNREKVLRIHKSAQRLSSLLNAVLTLSRLEAGKVNLSCEAIDLVEEVEHAAASMLPLAEQKGLELTVECQGPCFAVADESSLDSVLNNLIGNAIKFTSEGGVRVILEQGHDERVGGQAAVIRVADTGCGIAEEFLPHVFDEFRQEQNGRAYKQGGAGLGLAITKRLVDLMDGVIEVESQQGIGTTFSVVLPASNAHPAASGFSPEQNNHVGNAKRQHVLVMDDDELTLELTAAILESTHQVVTASTPEEALMLAASRDFDAFLLDISMGADLTGEDVLHALREMPKYQASPIIAVTAQALTGDRARFLRAGFDEYVSKPFEGSALLNALRQALEAE